MLGKIQEIAESHGIFISYEIVNQVTNGEELAVNKGWKSKITYTVYVTLNYQDIDVVSHDDLELALLDGIAIAKKYIKQNIA